MPSKPHWWVGFLILSFAPKEVQLYQSMCVGFCRLSSTLHVEALLQQRTPQPHSLSRSALLSQNSRGSWIYSSKCSKAFSPILYKDATWVYYANSLKEVNSSCRDCYPCPTWKLCFILQLVQCKEKKIFFVLACSNKDFHHVSCRIIYGIRRLLWETRLWAP